MSNDRENKNQIFRQGMPEMNHPSGIQTMSVAERMMKEFGIKMAPAELVKLPSGGKIYSVSSGLAGKSEIEIKAMTTREEDILTSRAYAKKGTTVSELIKSCVIDKSIDVDELISGDRNALMVAIRITGYGPKLNPELRCPKCEHVNHPEFDLSLVSIKPIGAEPVAPGVNEFECDLPMIQSKATFKLLTAKDEEELLKNHERKKKMFNSPVDTLMSDQLKMSLLSVNGKRDRANLSFFVDNITGQVSQALREKMLSIKPDVDMKQMFSCESCDFAEEVEIPIDREFFWPRSRSNK